MTSYIGMHTEEWGSTIDTDRLEVASRINAIIWKWGRISWSMTNPERTQNLEVEFLFTGPIVPSADPVEVILPGFPKKAYRLIPLKQWREFLVVDRKNNDRGTFIPARKIA
jgi:hypothetical protein